MNILKGMTIAVAALSICAMTSVPASAQNWRNHSRYNQRNWDVRAAVDAAERSSNAFRDVVEARDRNERTGRWMNNRERYFNELVPAVQRLDEAFERLRRVADNNRYRAGSTEMADVMARGREVDRFMRGNRFGWNSGGRYQYAPGSDLRARWNDLKRDINSLARIYGIAPLSVYR